MREAVVDREEIETMMWNLADTLTLVREMHVAVFGEDDEEEEDGDT